MNNDIRPPQVLRTSTQSTSPPPSSTNPSESVLEPMLENFSPLPPTEPKRRKKAIFIVSTILLTILAIIVAGWTWYVTQLSAVAPNTNEKTKIVIESGSDVATIAETLKAAELIRSESAFVWYIRIQGLAGSLQSGSYRLSQSEDVPAIVRHLTSGKTDTFSITFLPGNTLEKHREALLKAGYKQDAVDEALGKEYDLPLFADKPANADLEGYIYGETYNFAADATPEDILRRTFEEFQSVVEENELIRTYRRQGFTLYEGITLASIIQREVITEQDMAQVSQVFQLRLKRDMELGSDVTYQYAADKLGVPRAVDLDSPYNTRRFKGLPPGPIASPGEGALKAVGTPAKGDYVYFLSGDDDKTYFARTNEEHEQNIRDHCQKKCQII